jgi:hypothetical protein
VTAAHFYAGVQFDRYQAFHCDNDEMSVHSAVPSGLIDWQLHGIQDFDNLKSSV